LGRRTLNKFSKLVNPNEPVIAAFQWLERKKKKSKKEKRVKKQLHERNFMKKFEGKFS